MPNTEPPDLLAESSLQWALTHLSKYGDSDLLPQPFEFKAIRHGWDGLRSKLAKTELSAFEGRAPRRYLVPKSKNGYRVTIQLDPLDSIVYTAAVYEAAELIENHRIAVGQQVACSYRISPQPNGQLFSSSKDGWTNFSVRSGELARSCKYVLAADISDFYNQIGHHRVRNALEAAGVRSLRAKNLEHFLMNLTRGQSRGIPVGPSASIVLAEACLNDVDDFLLSKGYRHVRWVDDFRIFCDSARQASQALHDLTEYLYTAHRLALGAGKTEFFKASRFIKQIVDPQVLHKQEREKRVEGLREAVKSIFGYGAEIGISPEENNSAARETLKELLQQCIDKKDIHLGLIRYIFRTATTLKTRILFDLATTNLELLAPALREVALYLIEVTNDQNGDELAQRCLSFVKDAPNGFLDYCKLWVSEIAFQCSDQMTKEATKEILKAGWPRYEALLAGKNLDLSWVRSQKEIWQNYAPWDRRGVIASASALPTDERHFWLKRVQNAGDELDKVVAEFYRVP